MDPLRNNNAYDRLSALRQAPTSPPRMTRRFSPTLLIGAIGVVLLVAILAVVFVRNAPVVEVSPTETPDAPEISVSAYTNSLLDGEAYIAIAANIGTFPPSLSPGDTVQVVIAPSLDAVDVARSLPEQAVVREIQPPSEFGSSYVITIRAPQSIAASIIDAEKVHLSIVSEATS